MDIGVVGVGYWGKNIIRNLQKHKEIDNIFVFDKNTESIRKIRDSFPSVKESDSFEELLNKDIDAVFIITPPETHYELGKKVLEAGKNLYLEKPFVLSADMAKELVSIAEEKSLKIMSGHTFLYSPPVIKIKEIIENNGIGDIEYISFRRINLGIHQKAVNVIWDLLPHDLSMIFYWLGDSIKLKKGTSFLKTSVGKNPDIGFVFMEFSNGSVAEGIVSWLSPRKIRETIIVGTNKMIVYNDTEPEEKIKIYDKKVEKLEPDNFGEYQLSYRVGDVVSPRIETSEPLFMMIDDFIKSIKRDENPKSDGRFGIKVVSAIESILKDKE